MIVSKRDSRPTIKRLRTFLQSVRKGVLKMKVLAINVNIFFPEVVTLIV